MPISFETTRLDRIRTWMQRHVDSRKYPGSSFLLLHEGQEVFFNTCGLRNVEKGLSFDRNSLVRIYSMTKPVTSVAVMMLVEQGELHLDAPISDFLPEFNSMQALVPDAKALDQTEDCSAPTIHQLLTHTSGFSYPFNPGLLPEAMDNMDLLFKPDEGPLEVRVRDLATLPLAFQPGSRWEYSVSTDVLGRVVEVVSGRPLDQFFQQEILSPLAMNETGFSVPSGAGDRFASLYTPLAGDAMALNEAQTGGDTLRLVDQAGSSPFETCTTYSGGGGLISTIDDYAKFAEMLRRRGRGASQRLLGPKTVDFMMLNHLPGDIASMGPRSFAEQPMEGVGFGLGGSIVLNPGRVRVAGSVGDFSWGGMASTYFWIDRDLDLTAIFFTQLSPSSSYPSRAELKAMVHASVID